jgi:hypothetical protein
MWFKGIFLAVVSGYLAYELNDRELRYTWDFWLLNASIAFGMVSIFLCVFAAMRDLFEDNSDNE